MVEKFRIYSTNGNRYVTNDGQWVMSIYGYPMLMGAANMPYTPIMEFSSGICDRDGTYIYEGDILEEGEVKLEDFDWVVCKDDVEIPLEKINYHYKIVGNIHH